MSALLRSWLAAGASLLMFVGDAQALQVTISAESDGSSRPYISGITNLPHGTAISISVERRQTGFDGGAQTIVLDGKFRAGPFGPADTGLTPGMYKLTVLSVAASAQQPEVRAVLGEDGEKLKGKLIQREKFSGRHAVYTATFKVAGSPDSKADALQKAERASKDQVNFCFSGCTLQGFGSGALLDRCMRACMRH